MFSKPDQASMAHQRKAKSGRGNGLLLGALFVLAFASSACVTGPEAVPINIPGTRGGVTLLSPRCAKADSCVLGHVTAAESGNPLSHAAVFLQLEKGEGDGKREWILALTDEQGVFEIADPPAGLYRLSVYAPPREIEIGGIELGAAGTTMVPVRLSPS